MRIGFVGLGVMGLPMAANLRKAGHDMTVHDVSRERREAATAFGASAAGSLPSLAQKPEAVITMLPDTPRVEAVSAPSIISSNIGPTRTSRLRSWPTACKLL